MKPVFLEFISTENEKLNINLGNVVCVRLDTDNIAQIICVGDTVFRVRGVFNELNEKIKQALEDAS